jgi:hypothetical protein
LPHTILQSAGGALHAFLPVFLAIPPTFVAVDPYDASLVRILHRLDRLPPIGSA